VTEAETHCKRMVYLLDLCTASIIGEESALK